MAAIGILGGTFDPVHCGHLRLAVEMRERLSLDEVRLVPAGHPRLREPPIAAATLRLRMLETAVEGMTGLAVDPLELGRDGPTHTIDTLVATKAECPTVPLCFILGLDAFAKLEAWHRWPEILEVAHLAVATRPGAVPPERGVAARALAARRTEDPGELHQRPAGLICLVETPAMEISATGIRARLAEGRSIHYLVPEAVHQLIERSGTYTHAQ